MSRRVTTSPASRDRMIGCVALLIVMLSACQTTMHTSSPAASMTSTHTTSVCTPDPGKVSTACAGTPPTGRKGLSLCGGVNQPTCPPMPAVDPWVHLNSTARADVLAALRSCPEYLSPSEAFQLPASTAVDYDMPVLVLSATRGPSSPLEYTDYLVIRVLINGTRAATYAVHYDRAAGRIAMSGLGMQQPNDPNYGKPFPYTTITASAAIQMLQSARAVGPQSGTSPDLVYFDLDPKYTLPTSMRDWMGGGYNASVPIWRIQGSDDRLYFIGNDANVYDAAQLPIAPGDTLITP